MRMVLAVAVAMAAVAVVEMVVLVMTMMLQAREGVALCIYFALLMRDGYGTSRRSAAVSWHDLLQSCAAWHAQTIPPVSRFGRSRHSARDEWTSTVFGEEWNACILNGELALHHSG